MTEMNCECSTFDDLLAGEVGDGVVAAVGADDGVAVAGVAAAAGVVAAVVVVIVDGVGDGLVAVETIAIVVGGTWDVDEGVDEVKDVEGAA
jgi:hypothetical protein